MELKSKLPSFKEMEEKHTIEEAMTDTKLFFENKDIVKYAIYLNCCMEQIHLEGGLAHGVERGIIRKDIMNHTLYYFYRFNMLLSEYMVKKQIKEGISKQDTLERIDKMVQESVNVHIKNLDEVFQT